MSDTTKVAQLSLPEYLALSLCLRFISTSQQSDLNVGLLLFRKLPKLKIRWSRLNCLQSSRVFPFHLSTRYTWKREAASVGSCSGHLIHSPISLNSHTCYAKWKTIIFRINSRDNVFLPAVNE